MRRRPVLSALAAGLLLSVVSVTPALADGATTAAPSDATSSPGTPADATTSPSTPTVATTSPSAPATATPTPSTTATPAAAPDADITQIPSVRQVDVPLGGSAPFTFSLHDAGPDAATNVKVRFTVQSNDNPRPVLAGFTSASVSDENGGKVWSAGTIPAGGTESITITITATSPAVDSEISWSTSYDGVGEVCGTSGSCEFGAPIRTFVPGPAQDDPQLAATGSGDTTLTLVAGGLLAAGAVLLVAARRRRLG